MRVLRATFGGAWPKGGNIWLLVKLLTFLCMTLLDFPIVVSVAGVLMLAVFRPYESMTLSRTALLWIVIFYFALVVFAIKFLAYDIGLTDSVYATAFINNFIVFSVLAAIFVFLKGYTRRHPEEFVWLVRSVLAIHIIIFFVQFTLFMGTGNYLDLYELFTGIDARSANFVNGDLLSGVGAIRPTGLYAEPSELASVIFLLSLISIVARGEASFDWVVVPAAAAMFLSFSTLAAILSVLLVAYAIYIRIGIIRSLMFVPVFIVILAAAGFVFFDVVQLQIEKAEATYGLRLKALLFVFERTGIPLYLGHGPFGYDAGLLARASNEIDAREIASVNDAGLAVLLMLQFGMLGLVMYVVFLAATARTLPLFVALTMASLTKLAFTHIVFLALVAFVATESRRPPRESFNPIQTEYAI